MINLLRADFSRLIKNKFFLCSSFIVLLLSLYYGQSNAVINPQDGVESTMYPFEAMPVLAFIIAVFTTFFIGVNFSSKVISNKLSSGASKSHIYLSNAVVSLVVSVYLSLFYIIAGIRLMASGKFPANIYFSFVLIGAVLSVTFSALSTFFAFVLRTSSVAVVVSTLLIAVMFLVTNHLGSILGQSEFTMRIETVNGVPYNNAEVIPNDADITYTEVPNPEYCDGVKRNVYQFISDVLPTSHLAIISNMNISSSEDGVFFTPRWSATVEVKSASEVFDYVNIAYPLGLSVFITALGVLLFRKKQLS